VQPENLVNEKPKKKINIPKTIGTSLAVMLIFLSGFGIGSGRIVLNRDQLLRKSIQKNLPANLDYSSVEQVYDTLKRDYDGQLDNQKLLDGLKAGLAASTGDPYTEYMNKDAAKDFNEQLSGIFSGIGAELGKDEQGNIVVIAPIAGFPAEKAGLKPKDIVVEVDGKSTAGQSIGDAVGKIRGPKGTNVKLKVVRNKAQELNFDITREQISIPSVESKILDGNIGYIKVSRYGEDTAVLTTKAADDFKQKNVKGVILDVRGNPGGLLDAAVSVSSLWLDPGKTILQEKRDGLIIRTYKAKGTPTLKGIPTVVLINEGSASASEITAGALHDNNVAKLIGVKSFGKGSVQQLEQLGDGSVLKVTIARWYTPNGININKDGIKPDTEVKISDDEAKAKKDPQLDAAIKQLQQ
jgi:carboxyl-terminal processing protease